jgi:hypothetical protein
MEADIFLLKLVAGARTFASIGRISVMNRRDGIFLL